MLLTIFCLLLILGIVFYQSLQGLYSSLIMALATVAATLVAFSFYEPLAAQVYKSQPLYADAASLLVLMVIPLFILRTLLDRFLPGNVVPSVWVDRIGGGIFGLVTAMLLVGTFAVALQMLPWGRSVMGYDPYDDNLARKDTFFMLDAPGFTLGTVKFLSAGSLHGNENFATLHDDLNMEMWGARNRWELGGGEQARRYGQDEVKIPSIVRGKVTPGSLSVISVYDATTAQMSGGKTFGIGAPVWPLEPQAAEGRSRVFIAHVNIDRDAQDDDKWWRLMGTQFRLVTRDGASFYPVGYLMKKDGLVIAEDAVGNLKLNRPGAGAANADKDSAIQGKLTVDWVYRIPNLGDQVRVPWFITFRRVARAPIATVAESTLPKDVDTGHTVKGHVAVISPRDSAKGNFILQALHADVMRDNPVPFTIDKHGDEAFKKDADSEKMEGKLKGGALAVGTITGRSDQLCARAEVCRSCGRRRIN